MDQLEILQRALNYLTTRGNSFCLYDATESKRNHISEFNDCIRSHWQDSNGNEAIVCSSKIYKALGEVDSQFNVVVNKAQMVITKAEALKNKRLADGKDLYGRQIEDVNAN